LLTRASSILRYQSIQLDSSRSGTAARAEEANGRVSKAILEYYMVSRVVYNGFFDIGVVDILRLQFRIRR
jgi:hypothetical protein